MKSRIQSKFTPFITGDKVWLEARNLERNIINPKFTAKREGPFKVTKVLLSAGNPEIMENTPGVSCITSHPL